MISSDVVQIYYKLCLCAISSAVCPPNCIDLLVADVTAEIAAARKPLPYLCDMNV